jgi:hypothetical protein
VKTWVITTIVWAKTKNKSQRALDAKLRQLQHEQVDADLHSTPRHHKFGVMAGLVPAIHVLLVATL